MSVSGWKMYQQLQKSCITFWKTRCGSMDGERNRNGSKVHNPGQSNPESETTSNASRVCIHPENNAAVRTVGSDCIQKPVRQLRIPEGRTFGDEHRVLLRTTEELAKAEERKSNPAKEVSDRKAGLG